jgi:uncharacterized protein YkwD
MRRREFEITRFRTVLAATVATGLFALCASAGSAGAAATCVGESAAPETTETTVLVTATLCLLNRERSRYELRPLRLNTPLSAAAQAHSREMVTRRYFDHVTPSGVTPAERIGATGYLPKARAWTIGENIMWGTLGRDTPEAAVEAWMHSPDHRANILYGAFCDIGIGVVAGDPLGIVARAGTYTTDFGVRQHAPPRAR